MENGRRHGFYGAVCGGQTMLNLLFSRNIRLLLTGCFVSTTGDWLYAVATSLAVYIYSGHSTAFVSLLWLVRMLPYLLLGPVSGSVADRF